MYGKKVGAILLIWFMLGIGLVGCVDTEKILADTKVENVDLKKVTDGTYNGQHSAGETRAIVAVDVKSHEMTDIEILKHECWKGKKAEVIVEDVIEKQSLGVDIVSGATVSSKVILKAIENALRKGVN